MEVLFRLFEKKKNQLVSKKKKVHLLVRLFFYPLHEIRWKKSAYTERKYVVSLHTEHLVASPFQCPHLVICSILDQRE